MQLKQNAFGLLPDTKCLMLIFQVANMYGNSQFVSTSKNIKMVSNISTNTWPSIILSYRKQILKYRKLIV
jgi:3-hydroxymyristoyl/3-hydroxydecanoyl-(acyl carrier protein) dehydratase